MTDTPPPSMIRDRVFVSYSREDVKFFEEFKTMLAPAIQRGIVDIWDDTMIQPGAQWKTEIEKALSRAKVGVLLVSPSFFASRFITEKEVPPLLAAAQDGGATIFWVCLSSSLYDITEIAPFQAAHDVGKPLEYDKDKQGRVVKGPFGEMLRHPFSGVALCYKHNLPPEVMHIVATHSHEGDKVQRSIESIIFHHADFVDFDIAKYLGRKGKG